MVLKDAINLLETTMLVPWDVLEKLIIALTRVN
jgi:hypothetical protein